MENIVGSSSEVADCNQLASVSPSKRVGETDRKHKRPTLEPEFGCMVVLGYCRNTAERHGRLHTPL